MNLTDYLKTRDGALKENRFHRYAVLLLSITVLILGFGSVLKRQAVVLVPPTLEEQATVEAGGASQQMQIAWGMYIASLIGNVTPTSAQFLKGNVGRYLSPALYRDVVSTIDEQVKQINDEQVTLQFIPKNATYDASTRFVYINGEFISRSVRGAERRGTRTYEFGFSVRNYQVLVNHLRVCEGQCKRANGEDVE